MKIVTKITIFSACLLLFSCTIKGSFQGLFSYYKPVNSSKPSLLRHFENTDVICNARYSDSCRVMVTTGENLQACVQALDRCVVYIWSPNCKSDLCYALDRVQAFCSEKGMSLYVVAEYYDGELMEQYYNLNYPIIGIDTKFYKTNLTDVYLFKFLADLVGHKLAEEAYKNKGSRILYMENGAYVRSYRLLKDLVL